MALGAMMPYLGRLSRTRVLLLRSRRARVALACAATDGVRSWAGIVCARHDAIDRGCLCASRTVKYGFVSPDAVSADARLRALLAHPGFPSRFAPILEQFAGAYRLALSDAGLTPGAYDHLLDGFFERLTDQLANPFTFEPFHRQLRAPFDYYQFGVEFLRPLVDKATSRLRGHANLDRVSAQIAAGDNVIFLANHQTEGDPQAIALLLEDTHPAIGRDLIFVAGERVTTDPLAVPFSMGCNLLCIYSKRYIDHPPERKAAKQQHNQKTMERMSELLAEGGQCIYAAPSGGRDRTNAGGVVEVAAFDPASVEMYHLMARRSGRPSHFYPMALDTYEFLPPPDTIQRELGEARHIRRTGIGLAVGTEIDMDAAAGVSTDKHERRVAKAQSLWSAVANEYEGLRTRA
jgi:glycerol-3-phosphate O-acyltransferase